MIVDYIVLEDISSFRLRLKIIDLSGEGYKLHGDLIVLYVDGSEIYYQAMILKRKKCTD